MSRPIKKGATDQSTVVRIIDSTDGTPETGVVAATSGLDLQYRREGAAAVALTESDLAAVDSAHADGGMKHIGAGYYRVDLPDAAVATGADGVLVFGTVTGMIVQAAYHPLVAADFQDSVRLGLTALPNAAADAAGGLPISDAGGLDLDAKLANTNEITAARMGALTDWIDGGRLDLILDARASQTSVDTIGTNLDALITTVGVAGAGLTEAGGTGDHLTAVPWNSAWDTEVQSEVQDAIEVNHLDHLLAADYDPAAKPGVATALLNELVESDAGVSRFTVNALENAPSGSGASAETIADAVWDELLSGHTAAGSAGERLGRVPNAAAGGNGGLPTVDANNRIAGIQGTLTTLDALDTAQDTQHGTTQTAISALNDLSQADIRTAVGLASANLDTQLGDIVADTNELQTDWGVGGTHRVRLTSIEGRTGEPILRQGTAQSGSSSTIVLDVGANATDEYYTHLLIIITGGTGAGQARTITAYTGSTKTASVSPNWTTAPDNTSLYSLHAAGEVHVNQVENGAITAASFAAGAIDAAALNADAVTEIQGDKSGYKLASDGLDLVVPADPSAIPVLGTASIVAWIGYFGAWTVNEVNSDANSVDLRNSADTANLASHPTSDDGTTFSSGEAA